MSINLSQYSGTDEEVKVTFRSGDSSTGKFFLYDKEKDTYLFTSKESLNRINTRNGINVFSSYNDIVKVEPITPENPKQMPNELEPETLHTIATALTPEAIKYIESHEKYAEVMVNLLEEFVEKNLGNSTGELPFMIFDRMYLAKGRD